MYAYVEDPYPDTPEPFDDFEAAERDDEEPMDWSRWDWRTWDWVGVPAERPCRKY
jgi:hypothetical protein